MSAWEAPGQSDEWYTPRYIFDALGETFDLDVASPPGGPRHVPAARWYSDLSLMLPWEGFVWMNPPFGDSEVKRAWMGKFITHGHGIALIPDRTSSSWFQWALPQMDGVVFVSPRIKFERPDGTIGESPGTGTALMARGPRAVAALKRCGLGIYLPTREQVPA